MDDSSRLFETWDFNYKLKSGKFSNSFIQILKISKDLYNFNNYNSVLIIDENFHYLEHTIFNEYSKDDSNVTIITRDKDLLEKKNIYSAINDLDLLDSFDLIIYNPYIKIAHQSHPYLDDPFHEYHNELDVNFIKNFDCLFNTHLNDHGKIILYDEEGSISSLNGCPEHDNANDTEIKFKTKYYEFLETLLNGNNPNDLSTILIFNEKPVNEYYIHFSEYFRKKFDTLENSLNILDKNKTNWNVKFPFLPNKAAFFNDLKQSKDNYKNILDEISNKENTLKFYPPQYLDDCKYYLDNVEQKDTLIKKFPNINNDVKIIELTSKIINGKSKNKNNYEILIKHNMEHLYVKMFRIKKNLKWDLFENYDHRKGNYLNELEHSIFLKSAFGLDNEGYNPNNEKFDFLKGSIQGININFKLKNKDFILVDHRHNPTNYEKKVNPTIIQKRLEKLLEILNPNGDIFIQVNKEVLGNADFKEFRDTFSNCLKTIIKLEKEIFLLHFTNYSELYSIYDISKDNNTKISLGILNKKDKIIKSEDFYNSWFQIKNLDEFEKKQVTNLDIKNLIKKGQKDNEKGQSKIISNISDIKTILIDDLMPRVEILKNGMDGIEKTIENIENNAEKINRESEIAIQTCNNNKTSDYEEEKKLAQKKYPEIWNLLNEESKDYIAGAELLFNLIYKSELKEFSSFILYYSKALENEILEKIFKKFLEKLISKKVDFENIFKITPPNKEFGSGRLTRIKKNISPFKNEVFKIINEKKSNTNELKITIGAMDHILKKVINTESDSYKFIKIIRELNVFLNESIINYNSKKLKEIIDKRNGAAHTEKFDYKEAVRFHSLISLFLKDFYKKSTDKKIINTIKTSITKILIPAKLIEEFKKIHGDKYDYSKAESFSGSYHRIKNAKIKLAIVCKIHGEFLMTPGAHLNGSGCPMCILKQ